MHFRGNASHLARENTTGLGRKFRENLRVFEVDLLKWKIKALGWHRLVMLPEINAALDGLGLGHNKKKKKLAKFAVESATVEERVKLHLLKTTRSIQALLVAGGRIT